MRALVAALLVAGVPALAAAQQSPAPLAPPDLPESRPVSGFVVDARGVLAKFGQRPLSAAALGVTAADMPGPGFGVSLGAHVYPLRLGRVAFGIGGEVLMARRAKQKIDTAGEPVGAELQSRMYTLAPQISGNFGHRNGWSYVSAGIGTASFETWPVDHDNPDRRVRAINYGGGARWFTSSHLAFTIDLRFYSVAAGLANDAAPAERPRARLMVISAGVSVR